MNTSRTAAAAALLALAAAPAAAPGQGNKPPKPPAGTPAITLDVTPATVLFGTAARLSGRLGGVATERDVLVRLEADDTRPYGDAYVPTTLTTRTAGSGNWKLSVSPARNTQYRVVAESSPPATSAGRLVLVRPKVGLTVADTTPRRGQRVRFSGTVEPAHDGRRALIQRRSATGRFVTVARPRLRASGAARSAFSRRIRIRRDGVYRVKVARHADHANGFSAPTTIDVGG